MSSVANQYAIGLIFCLMIMPGAAPPRDNLSDKDLRLHVERKCREQNLPYYKVSDKHYCCGCPASQYVNGDCTKGNQNTTICSKCPYNDTVKSNTYKANTQRQCNISVSSDDCAKMLNSHYVSGNSMNPPRYCPICTGTPKIELCLQANTVQPNLNSVALRCECNSDSFRYQIGAEKFQCIKHSPCPPNWHVSRKGNATKPYECSQCPVGKCTNGYSFNSTCQLKPCTNASGLSDPVIPVNAMPTKMAPSTTPADKSLEGWVIPVIIASSIIGGFIGALVTYWWIMRHHRNSEGNTRTNNCSSSSQAGEGDPLLEPSASDPVSDEVDSANSGNSAANISSGCGTSIEDGDTTTEPHTPSTQPPNVSYESHQQNAAPDHRSESDQQHFVIEMDQNSAECVVNIPQESETDEIEMEQVAHTVGHVTGKPLMTVDANPHKTEDEPLKGCIRTVDPDVYEQKFRDQGFQKIYEPDVAANCMFAAVVKGKNPTMQDDSVAEPAAAMRRETVQYMQEHKQQFLSSIPSSSSSNTIDEFLEKLKIPTQPCDEIVARAIALKENIDIQIVNVNGIGQKYCGSQNQDQANDTIYIGRVEKNYFLLLKLTSVNQDADTDGSTVRSSVSDGRVEMNDQSVVYTAVTVDGPQTSSQPCEVPPTAENRSSQSEQSVSNFTRPPERLREKEDWDLFDSTDQMKLTKNHLRNHPELDLSVHLDRIDLAKAMLVGSPKLLPGVIPLVNKETSAVNALVRLPNLVNQPEVVISDAIDIHKNDAMERRRFLIKRVMEEQGESLSVRLLLSLSNSDATDVILHRYFSDCFLKYLDTTFSETMANAIP